MAAATPSGALALAAATALLPLALAGCTNDEKGQRGAPAVEEKSKMTITVTSPAFEAGATIPKKHTGEGEDTSPPLRWQGVPDEAKELALVCHDPDAPREGGWVHWVVYKLPANTTALAEGASGGWMTGQNDWGKEEYGGPMPPPGHGVHHYHFKLYALDAALPPEPALTMNQLLERIEGHVIAKGELIGTYERKKK